MEKTSDELKARVLRYQRTGDGLEALISDLAIRIYGYAQTKWDASEDDAGELLLHMLPRLRPLLDRYTDVGVPFEHYLNAALRWNLRAQQRAVRLADRVWRSARHREFWESAEGEHRAERVIGPEFMTLFRSDGSGRVCTAADRRRLLLVALRDAWHLQSEEVETVAETIGVSLEWLSEKVERLRASVLPKLDRLEMLRNRRNRAFARMRLLQEDLAREADAGLRRRIRARIGEQAGAWRTASEQISRIALRPSHRRIAEELGVPKGTVDSCFIWVRKRLEGVHADSEIQYA